MSDINSNNSELTQLMSGPRGGLSLAIASLILPVLSGVLLIFVTAFPVALGINVATVFATAVLVAIDASRLGKVDLKGTDANMLAFSSLDCALYGLSSTQ